MFINTGHREGGVPSSFPPYTTCHRATTVHLTELEKQLDHETISNVFLTEISDEHDDES